MPYQDLTDTSLTSPEITVEAGEKKTLEADVAAWRTDYELFEVAMEKAVASAHRSGDEDKIGAILLNQRPQPVRGGRAVGVGQIVGIGQVLGHNSPGEKKF